MLPSFYVHVHCPVFTFTYIAQFFICCPNSVRANDKSIYRDRAYGNFSQMSSAAHAGPKRTVQKEFITVLGPYLRLAKTHGQEDSFFERVYTLWFIRWPLNPSDHEDTDAMEDYKSSTKKVCTLILWEVSHLISSIENKEGVTVGLRLLKFDGP